MSMARMPAACGLVVALPCVLALLTGCASLGPDPSRASSAAQRFHTSLTSNETTQACDLLAAGTLDELEQTAGTPCPKALADAGLPDATTVTTTDVYGLNARVVLDGDTVFLARFGAQWKVTAAGCKPRPGLPYDCEVRGR